MNFIHMKDHLYLPTPYKTLFLIIFFYLKSDLLNTLVREIVIFASFLCKWISLKPELIKAESCK